jgi:hypothetical protein
VSVVLAEPLEPGLPGLEEWAQSVRTLAAVSADMARTAFVPNSLRVFDNNGKTYDEGATAAQVTAAILTGRELGLEPMAALRSINVINGTPALSALALRALLLKAGHRIWVEEANNSRAIVVGARAGDPHEQRITWTLDDAKARNLAGRPNWRSQPRNMLIARATAEVARLVAADVILGVPYVTEELEDGDLDTQPPAVEPAPSTRELRRRRSPTKPALVAHSAPLVEVRPEPDEPPLDEPESAPAATDAPSEEKLTPAQMKALQAGFKDLGLEDRTERLELSSAIVERKVPSAKDLTRSEAGLILTELNRRKASSAPSEEEPPLD